MNKPLPHTITPGWRVAQIDRTRFYVTNDALPVFERAEVSNRRFRTREEAARLARELNAKGPR